MIHYANVRPVQTKPIPWGWTNVQTPHGLFVKDHPGAIQMPHLVDYFDWSTFIVSEQTGSLPFGTRDMRSIFTTAWRFLGFERLLTEFPDLTKITDEFASFAETLITLWGEEHITDFVIGDDIAGNNGLFISYHDFHLWLLPQYKRLINLAKRFDMTVIFHSDGDVWEILEDLEESGVNILNYQSVGKMQHCRSFSAYGYMKLDINEVEEQARVNPLSFNMQHLPVLQGGTSGTVDLDVDHSQSVSPLSGPTYCP